jgi:sarcosine oxidase subunit beta
MSSYDVVIAGAGSVGVPLSYYSAKKGLKVLVVDKEASWGRGQNRAAIGGIRATFSDPAKIGICTESLAIASTFQEEHGIDIEWRRGGYLFVAYDEERETAFRDLLSIQRAAGLGIDWIGSERVAELAPGIKTEGLRGGTFSPGDGYASSLKTSVAFHKLALEVAWSSASARRSSASTWRTVALGGLERTRALMRQASSWTPPGPMPPR